MRGGVSNDNLLASATRLPWRTVLGISREAGIPHKKRKGKATKNNRSQRLRKISDGGNAWERQSRRFKPGEIFLKRINSHELSIQKSEKEFFRDPLAPAAGWDKSKKIPRSLSVAALSMPDPRFANFMSKPRTKSTIGPGSYLESGPRSVKRLEPLHIRSKKGGRFWRQQASAVFKATERHSNGPFSHMRTWADERNDAENTKAKQAAAERIRVKQQQLDDEKEEREEAEAEAAEKRRLEETGQQEAPWLREANAEYRKMRRGIRKNRVVQLKSDSLEENFIQASLRYLDEIERKKRANAAMDQLDDMDSKPKRLKMAGSRSQKQRDSSRSGNSDKEKDGSRGIRIFRRDDEDEKEFLEWQKSYSKAR